MPSLWPFMGRTCELAAVREAVEAGGVVLAGPAGVGKSRLATEAVGKLTGTLRVSATEAAAEIPLGALAHLLPSQPPTGNVIRWAADQLLQLAEREYGPHEDGPRDSGPRRDGPYQGGERQGGQRSGGQRSGGQRGEGPRQSEQRDDGLTQGSQRGGSARQSGERAGGPREDDPRSSRGEGQRTDDQRHKGLRQGGEREGGQRDDVIRQGGSRWDDPQRDGPRGDGLRRDGLRRDGLDRDGLRQGGLRQGGLRKDGLRQGGLRGDGLLLLVDDAHLLDPISAALVHHLVVSGEARVLATVRSGARASDAVTALWKDDLVPRLELAPLEAEQVTQLLAGALGGNVETGTARRLHRVSGGNVLFLRELVLAGQAGGALTEHRRGAREHAPGATGIWRWDGELSVTTRLRELIESRIGDIREDERDALEFVAYGEPLSPDVLAELAAEQAARRLEARQLIVAGEDQTVRLAHPLYGEAIRATCGPLRTREVLRRLADAVAARGTPTREETLRIAVWRLDSGTADDPALLTAACRTARLVRDLELAVRLARAAVAAGGGVAASLLLASVLGHADRHDEADAVMAEVAGQPMDDMLRAEYEVLRAVTLHWRHGRGTEACAALDAAAKEMTGLEARQGVMILQASILTDYGKHTESGEVLARIRESGPLTYIPVGIAAVEATTAALQGKSGPALTLVEDTLAEIEGRAEGLPTLAGALLDAGTTAALFAGDLAAARRYAKAGYRMGEEYAGWDRAIIPFGARRAQINRLRGELTAAIRLGRQGSLRLRGPIVYAGPCLGELAHAYALIGDLAAARSALDLAEEYALHIGVHADPPLRTANAWFLSAQGDLTGAVEAALEAAEAVRDLQGYELFALHDLVRLGSPELVADRLARLATEADGALAPLCARHASADGDPAELDAVATAFEELGFVLYAAEAAAQAATAHGREGPSRAARSAETHAWALARRCQGAHTPALTGLAAPDLTPRQREIAQLAASGLSNREIADRLVVSIRTVANTLGTAYDKLGVNDRTGLSRVLRGFDD